MFCGIKFSSPIFLYFLFLLLFVSPFLPDHWANDSNAIAEMAGGIRDADPDSGGYYYAAIFFGALGSFSYVLQAGIAYSISIFYDENVGRSRNILLILLFLTPAFLFGLVRPQKEVFVFLLTIFVLKGPHRVWKSDWHDILYISIVYALYSALMRPYYILIAIFLLGLLFFGRWGRWGYWVFLVFSLLLCFCVPADILTLLQGSRDVINTLGRGVDENQRTAFVNVYLNIDGGFDFLINYLYAFTYLNFSILYFWDLPSFVLTAYVVFCLIFYTKSISRVSPFWRRRLFLFLSHFIVLPIFEPDLGSYFRHLSSVFIYLIPFFHIERFGRDA